MKAEQVPGGLQGMERVQEAVQCMGSYVMDLPPIDAVGVICAAVVGSALRGKRKGFQLRSRCAQISSYNNLVVQ